MDKKIKKEIYNFGNIPLADNYKSKEKFPIKLMLDIETKLLHIDKVPDRDSIYSEYDHLSSASKGNMNHLKDLANLINQKKGIKTILEVGCNDGIFLKYLNSRFKKYGIDPAKNVYRKKDEDDFIILHEFLDTSIKEKIKNIIPDPIDAIIGINVFAHNESYDDMFSAMYELLDENGFAHIEIAYASETIVSGNFDTMYHEHYCSYTFTALKNIVESIGFIVSDVEIISSQGGSLRVTLRKKVLPNDISKNVAILLQEEKNKGYDNDSFYENLSKIIDKKINLINDLFVKKYTDDPILIVGCPARGVVTANVCGFNKLKNAIAFDDTPEKQGMVLPGTDIMVMHPNDINYKDYKIACLLAWTYEKDLLKRLKDFGFKGKIFIPFPDARFVEVD